MSNRLLKCAALFGIILLLIFLLGFLLPEELSQTVGSRIVSEKTIIPGGQSIGLQMDVEGALIVGVEQDTELKIGDMIVSVDGQEVNGPQDVMDIVGSNGNTVELTVVRDKKRMQFEVTPYYDSKEEMYKLGLWIKERIAGIGTLTFYDPDNKTFACLGHGIYEPETGTLLGVKNGSLLQAKVSQVTEGKAGEPGELGGVIYNFDTPVGDIEKNLESGIYGTVINDKVFDHAEPIPVASVEEIEEGNAIIQTTVDGNHVRRFQIEITEINRGRTGSGRGLEFRVTDEELLHISGGIVQGMSGSPIIQNGKLVGAVTHVLVNDPTRGYGIFIENMLETAEK